MSHIVAVITSFIAGIYLGFTLFMILVMGRKNDDS